MFPLHTHPPKGSLAKIGATVVTYPMIVVKSRLQVRHQGSNPRLLPTKPAASRLPIAGSCWLSIAAGSLCSHLLMLSQPASSQATNEHTAAENRYGGTADAVRRIYAEEGASGFFAGLRDKILQTVGCALPSVRCVLRLTLGAFERAPSFFAGLRDKICKP